MNNDLYKKSIETALEYIEHNIEGNLSLEIICRIVGFSPYHFHRIFHAVTGKSLHKYILEQKLNYSASKLLYESSNITEIALDYGFSSPSSFARSFKEHFGCTPTRYKEFKERKFPIEFANVSFQKFSFDSTIENHLSEVVLTDLQTLCIGVIGLSETWENPDIEKAFFQIFNWLRSNNRYTSDTKICGITLDTPEVQDLSACRYYACATVNEHIYDEHLAYKTFQTSGSYICCKLNRSIKNFAEYFFCCMDYIYGFYMISHNLSPDYRPFVEFYELGENNNININFCVPVKKI